MEMRFLREKIRQRSPLANDDLAQLIRLIRWKMQKISLSRDSDPVHTIYLITLLLDRDNVRDAMSDLFLGDERRLLLAELGRLYEQLSINKETCAEHVKSKKAAIIRNDRINKGAIFARNPEATQLTPIIARYAYVVKDPCVERGADDFAGPLFTKGHRSHRVQVKWIWKTRLLSPYQMWRSGIPAADLDERREQFLETEWLSEAVYNCGDPAAFRGLLRFYALAPNDLLRRSKWAEEAPIEKMLEELLNHYGLYSPHMPIRQVRVLKSLIDFVGPVAIRRHVPGLIYIICAVKGPLPIRISICAKLGVTNRELQKMMQFHDENINNIGNAEDLMPIINLCRLLQYFP